VPDDAPPEPELPPEDGGISQGGVGTSGAGVDGSPRQGPGQVGLPLFERGSPAGTQIGGGGHAGADWFAPASPGVAAPLSQEVHPPIEQGASGASEGSQGRGFGHVVTPSLDVTQGESGAHGVGSRVPPGTGQAAGQASVGAGAAMPATGVCGGAGSDGNGGIGWGSISHGGAGVHAGWISSPEGASPHEGGRHVAVPFSPSVQMKGPAGRASG